MAIKKDYVELVNFLETNKNKKVETILEMVREMCSQKVETTFRKDEDGNVTHVYCYYHKVWEDVSQVEYGKKASNKATGLNTMCKVGLNQWSKQQRVAQKEKNELLEKMAKGEVTQEEFALELDAIELRRNTIIQPE